MWFYKFPTIFWIIKKFETFTEQFWNLISKIQFKKGLVGWLWKLAGQLVGRTAFSKASRAKAVPWWASYGLTGRPCVLGR
jgi:hypothetical protein